LVVPETDTRLENLLLEAFYLGHRRVRLTNRRQPHAAVVVSIDFTPAEERQVSDGFALAARGGTLTIEGRAEYGHTLRQVLPVHALLHSLQEPRTVLIQDPLTGATRYMMEGVTLPYTPHPAEQHLIDDLEVIQGAFPHKSFRFPATCTYEQAAFIHQVAMIIRTGEEIGTMGQLSFTLPAGRVDAYLAEIPDDGILRNQHIQEHKMAHFLGTDLDVGVSTVSLCPLRLVRSPEELRVEAAGRAPEERIQVTLIPADTTDPVVVRRFERFRPKGRDVA
jgi:hypothetical protein